MADRAESCIPAGRSAAKLRSNRHSLMCEASPEGCIDDIRASPSHQAYLLASPADGAHKYAVPTMFKRSKVRLCFRGLKSRVHHQRVRDNADARQTRVRRGSGIQEARVNVLHTTAVLTKSPTPSRVSKSWSRQRPSTQPSAWSFSGSSSNNQSPSISAPTPRSLEASDA